MKTKFFTFFFLLVFGISSLSAQDDALHISREGNVGIGTSNPAAKLHVVGAIRTEVSSDEGGRIELINPLKTENNAVAWTLYNMTGVYTNSFQIYSYPANKQGKVDSCCIPQFIIYDNGNTTLVPSGGNVGIGTTTPASKLSVVGSADFSGNVGIGTTSPIHALDVNGRINVTNGVIQRGGAAITSTSDLGLYSRTEGHWIRIVTNKAPIRFFSDDSYGTNINLSIESNGNVGIGTVPKAKLHVDGVIVANQGMLAQGIATGKSEFKSANIADGNGKTSGPELTPGYAMTTLSIYANGYLAGPMKINGLELKGMLQNSTDTWRGNTGLGLGEHSVECPDNSLATGIRITAYNNCLDGNVQLRCTTLATGFTTAEAGMGTESALSIPMTVNADNQAHISGCPAGTFVKGVKIEANYCLDGNLRVYCTGILKQ